MYMSYIPIAEARGFTTHLIKSPSFMFHLPLRLFTYFYFECRQMIRVLGWDDCFSYTNSHIYFMDDL